MNGLHAHQSEVFQHDMAVLKQYRADYLKITLHKVLRRAGYEAIDGEAASDKGKKNSAGNAGKLDASLSRTKATIFELAMCNPWEHFITLTLSPEYHNREDLNTYKKKLSTWLKNYNRLNQTNIKYLLIPELHKDGKSWHMHGLIMGLPIEHLQEFTLQDKLPYKILLEIAKGHRIFNWPTYAKTFGYVSLSTIQDDIAIAKYITKYITKALTKSRIELNNHMYYSSQGLKRAEVLYIGKLTKDLQADYENDYVKIKTLRSFEDATKYFTDE